jgi:hypothetical protein
MSEQECEAYSLNTIIVLHIFFTRLYGQKLKAPLGPPKSNPIHDKYEKNGIPISKEYGR